MSQLNQHSSAKRVGRMANWHKKMVYFGLLTCAITGLIWFGLGEIAEYLPPQLRFWWVTHGLSGLLALCILGSALPQHLLVTWRSHRNRLAGGIATLVFALLAITSGLLFYGNESMHALAKWTHIGLGISLCLIFPWHIIKGRSCLARLQTRVAIK